MTDLRISNEELEKFLAMDFWEFDKNEKGWRSCLNSVNTAEDYASTAKLIEIYLAKRHDMAEFQRSLVCFHAGQNNAFAANVEEAIDWFKRSIDEDQPDWNAYTRGTIAFLKRDRKTLEDERSILAELPGQLNLNILDWRIYLEAYCDKN